MGKTVPEWDRAYMGYLSVSAAQLYCESKTPLKNKSFENKDVKREDKIGKNTCSAQKKRGKREHK